MLPSLRPALTTLLLASAVPAQLSVAILQPQNNQVVSGSVIVAGTSTGLTTGRVSVSVDGGPFALAQGTDSWTFAWDTAGLVPGMHTLTARARNGLFGPTEFDTVTVVVDAAALTVTITTPAEGETVFDTFVATGTSTNATQVELQLDGGAFSPANGIDDWNAVFEASSLAPGAHTLTARASDGTTDVLDTVGFTVGPPPTGGTDITYLSSVDAAPLTARLWLPQGYDPANGPRPLLIYLHGAGGNGNVLFTAGGGALTQELDARGWIAVSPDGRAWGLADQGCQWMYSPAYVDSPNPDVGPGEQDILDAIAWAQANFSIDTDRIYLSGFSYGGRGSYIIGLKNPDRFAAIAPLGPPTDMYEVYVWRREPAICKEGMLGGEPGDSPFVDTMYTITSGRFLLENAYNLPVFHGHGQNDTVASNTGTMGRDYLHGWHVTTDTTWADCFDTTMTLCFGHTPTLSELHVRHPEGYDWAWNFPPVPHVASAEMFVGAPASGGTVGTPDPNDPTRILGALDFLAAHTLVTDPETIVYKTYTDQHRQAYWATIDSATPWLDTPAAIRVTKDVTGNALDVELARAANVGFDLDAAGLSLAAGDTLTIAVERLDEPVYDPALDSTGEALAPSFELTADLTGVDWVVARQDGALVDPASIVQTNGSLTLPAIPVTAPTVVTLEGVAAFVDLGSGLAGSAGVPALSGSGTLEVGTPTTLDLAGAPPLAPAVLLFGTQRVDFPLLGGTVVPLPLFTATLATDGDGNAALPFAWPVLPSEVELFVQAWIADTAAPAGIAASNALRIRNRPIL